MIQKKAAISWFFVIIFAVFSTPELISWAQLNPLALPKATLTAAVGTADTTLTVNSTTGFPASGFVALDTEVMSYTNVTSTTIVLGARGQLSTTAAAHSSGAVATYFPVHAGLLTSSIDAAATTLNLNSTATFPSGGGSVLIDQEILGYSGTTGTALTSVTRGTNSTAAAAHNAGAVVIGRPNPPFRQTYIAPRLLSASDNFSGFALVNLSDGPANVTLTPTNSDGSGVTVTDSNGNSTTVSKSFVIPAHQQFVADVPTALGDLGGDRDFYAEISTGNPDALGVVPIGTLVPGFGLTSLDIAPVSTAEPTDVILPVAFQNTAQLGPGVALEIGIVESVIPSAITANFVDANGNVVQSTTLTPSASSRTIRGLSDLFSNLANQEVTSGYIHLTSLTPFLAYELLHVGKENAYFEGKESSDASPTVRLPLAISGGAYSTRLLLVDGTPAVSGQTPVGVVNAVVTAYTPDGSLLSGPGITNPATVTFPVSGQFSGFIGSLLGLRSNQFFLGNLKISLGGGSSTSGILASALLLNNPQNELTSIIGQINPKPELTLTPALIDALITTGLTVVNPNDTTATAVVNFIRGNGQIAETKQMIVPPNGQAVTTLASFFPNEGPSSDGYIQINSTLPVFGAMVFEDGVFLASTFPVGLRDALALSPNPMGLATPNSPSVPLSASSYPLTVQIPTPAPTGGLTVNLSISAPVIASLGSNTVTIPAGQTNASVTVFGNISGSTLVEATAPGFTPAAAVVAVQNATDLTVSRNVILSPQHPTVFSGGQIQFSLTFDTTNPPPVEWLVSGVQNGLNSVGTITQSGFFTAPLLLPTDQPLLVQIGVININTTFIGAATIVTVLPPPAP
ncbi:MAG: hypothetical protein PHX83_14015 [Acidobacteriia bacterium]|nr:hypothetical protein [Terriglobia bacterium]